jgi:glycosyltransferase involved in cell wall biosynthesis
MKKYEQVMKVSIVIPAYNAENFIAECLNSVFDQTYPNIEIVVVNDGSKDSTNSLLKQYSAKDSRVVIVEQENSGTHIARKNGIKNSTGESILILDSDDYLELNAVELLVKKMQQEEADIVVGNHFHHEYGRTRLVKNRLTNGSDKMSLLQDLLSGELKGYIWGRLFKRELFENLTSIPITVSLAEDVITNFHIVCKFDVKVVLMHEGILHYIIHGSNLSSSTNPVIIESVFEQNAIVEKMLNEVDMVDRLEHELADFKCRNWIVYCRMGGEKCMDKTFYRQFYKDAYRKGKNYIPIYYRIEFWSYYINVRFGRSLTTCSGQL